LGDEIEFDDLGPLKVIHVHEPSVGLKAILVVDNVATGPSIGGLRMAADVSVAECARLARAMTLKNAAARLPHGGGKSVMFGDPKMTRDEKEARIRAFACSLRHEHNYIFGPDMGTDEGCMAWVNDEIGRCVGLPREQGGIPLDEIGATGWGVAHAAQVAIEYCHFDMHGARVVIQGFGAVGMHAARFLSERGAILVGASDSRGAVYDEGGLGVAELIALKTAGKSVIDSPSGEKLERDAVIDMECEIWVPAARPDVINAGNVERLKAKLVVQGANIPVTEEAENTLHERNVLSIPDFIANAGGVICGAMEFHGATEGAAMNAIAEKITRNTREVLEASRRDGKTPRAAAVELANRRVRRAMDNRRWSLF